MTLKSAARLGEVHISLATGQYTNGFRVETETIQQAAADIKYSLPRTIPQRGHFYRYYLWPQ